MTANAPYRTQIESNTYDYIIVGGGLCGCVVASRLSQAGLSVLVIEAGPDEHVNPQIQTPLGGPLLHNTHLEYNYKTLPQKHLNGRQVHTFGGAVLSGSSAVNYGAWTRGHSADFNAWGDFVNDKRWSYNGLLKYFRRTEHHHDPNGDPQLMGFEGNIHTVSGGRGYPLAEPMKQMYEGIGLKFNPNCNDGEPLGELVVSRRTYLYHLSRITPVNTEKPMQWSIAEKAILLTVLYPGYGAFTENWRKAARQPAGYAYDMSKTTILTSNFVKRVNFKQEANCKPRAESVELVDGRKFNAKHDIIMCCGALRTPQVLMISGVGPKDQLSALGIESIVDVPQLGSNLHDHSGVGQWWKLRQPEDGVALAIGHPNFFGNQKFLEGFPCDWVATTNISAADLADGRRKDGMNEEEIKQRANAIRGDVELLWVYVVAADWGGDFNLPKDGSVITGMALHLLPTSRGRVGLASINPLDHPAIDPNYCATENDKITLREAVRLNIRAAETPAGRAIIEGELPPPGYPALHSQSSDEEIDARIRHMTGTWFHPAGTASMGTVVDTDCRVNGIDALRIIDASILPLPIAAHYQAAMYATAEAAADIILGHNKA